MPAAFGILVLAGAASLATAAQTNTCDQALESYQRKQYSEALSLAGKALQTGNDDPACVHLYGLILGSLERLPDAEEYLARAVVLKPADSNYVSDLGAVLHKEKKYAQAVPVLRHAVELAPDNLTARMMLARSYVFSFNELKIPNFVDLTLQQLNYIVAKDPNFPAVHHHLALVYINTGELEKAEQELRTELRLAPHNGQVRMELGETLLKLNQPKKAITELGIAAKENPQVAPIYFSLGKAYRQDGEPAQALSALRKCVELDPKFPTCHYLLGQVYRDLNQPENAREQLRLFQQLNPAAAPAN